MRLKIALASATAIGLFVGAAQANDSNTLYIEQIGNGNSASVHQSTGGGNNDIGTLADPVTQQGDGNSFSFSNVSNNFGSNNDVIDVEQIGNQNTFTSAAWNNANNNVIDDVEQIGNQNRVRVSINGPDGGLVDDVLQQGNANHIVIEQEGSASVGNQVLAAKQIGNNNGLGPDGNGDRRRAGTYILQRGAGGNVVTNSYIEGDDNIGPAGNSNTYRNTHRIEQTGANNTASASTLGSKIGLEFNRIWIFQTGDDNASSVSQGTSTASTGNYATVDQIGNNNVANGTQLGSGNTITSAQAGNSNRLSADQTGDDNIVNVSISGDFNGNGTFTGSQLTLANASGLTSGQIVQTGSGNTALYDVVSSNSNQFAFAQLGSNNLVDGNVTGGGSNQAVVVQGGNSNVSSFSQSGAGGNMLSVSQ